MHDNSPADFKALSDFLIKKYGEKGVPIDTLIQNEVDTLVNKEISVAKANNKTLTYEQAKRQLENRLSKKGTSLFERAHEEVVARSMEKMLSDTNAISVMEELKTENHKLWQKMKDFFTKWQKQIHALYKKYKFSGDYANVYESIKDSIDDVMKLFSEGLVNAGENYQYVATESAQTETKKATVDSGVKYKLSPDSDIEANNINNGTKHLDLMIEKAKKSNNPEELVEKNVMYRSDIGQIDFVWGKPGNGEKLKGGYGFAHIIAKHGESTAKKAIETIAKGTDYSRQGNDNTDKSHYRLRLYYDGCTAILSKDPGINHWLLTAWDNKEETVVSATGEVRDSHSATAVTPTLNRRNGVNATVSIDSIRQDTENSQEKSSEKSELKYSFGGRNSKTANKSLLAKAEQMESEGAKSEEIRQGTGWFRGYDGGWRYEINDLESSLIENPKIYVHDDGQGPYFSGKLTDILNHKDLFKAYPQLKKIKVRICTLDYNASGAYMTDTNDILLNFELFNRNTKEYQDYYDKYFKDEIEEIEQTPEYKEYSKIVEDEELNLTNYEEWLKLSQSAAKKFFSSEIGRRYYELMCLDAGFEGERIELGWSKAARSTLMHELQHAIQVIEGFEDGANGDDKNYYNNAGEVESRDVQARLDYTSEQRKNIRPDIDRKNVVLTKGIRFSERNYSYEALISKPDMQVTTVNDKVTYKATSTIRKNIVNQAVKNAIAVGHANSNGNAVVHVKDINTDVIVSKRSLMHGLDRRLNLSTPVMLKIGEVLSNSIRINELTPKQESASSSYVLIGYATSKTNNYIVRAVVNKYTNEVDSVDILYAVSTKKETAGKLPGSHIKNALPTVSTISISNLLDYVNRYFPDILPEDVLKHYGHTERPAGEIGESALFSERDYSYEDYNKPINIKDVQILRSIGKKSVNNFTSEDIEKSQKWAYKFYKELGTKSPFFRAWFGDWRANDFAPKKNIPIKNKVSFNGTSDAVSYIKTGLKSKTLFRGDIKNTDTDFTINIGAQVYNDTLTYANRALSRANDFIQYNDRLNILFDIKQLCEDAVLFDTEITRDDSIPDRAFVHKFYALTSINKRSYLVKIIVDEINSQHGDIRRAYNLNGIKITPTVVSQVYKPAGTMSAIGSITSISSISDLYALVKKCDKEFKPGKPVNPALLNEDGTPKEFYHGTDAKFTVFDRAKGRSAMDIQGMFFSPWELDASGYGKNVGKYYLSIKNPAPEGVAYKALNMFKGQDYAGIKARDYLISLGYDGVNNSDEEIIAFYPEQIKSATDNIGTFDSDNPDIRFSERDTEYAKELEAVNAQITKENKKLKEDVSDLKELLKLQTQETHGKMMKKSSIDAVAKKIMREKCFLTD